MRRLLLATLLALAPLGCGSDGPTEGSLDRALGYFPADAGSVFAISTELEGDQVEALDEGLAPLLLGGRAEEILRQLFEEEGSEVSFDDDVKPLLGNHLVVGSPDRTGLAAGFVADVEGGSFLAAIDTTDGDKLREVLEEIDGLEAAGEASGAQLYGTPGDAATAVDGDVLVVAEDERRLRAALGRPDGGGRLTEERFEAALAGLPGDALVRGYGDLRGLLEVPSLARFGEIPWVAALRTFGAAASFEEDHVTLDLALNTDPRAIGEDDLPFAPGGESPPLVLRDGEISGASRDQSRTTVFLIRAVRAAYPDSRFVRDVATIERELDIDFEREVLQQFNGPSASLLRPDGSFAARSEVRDPDFIAQRMRELAPDLGRLIQDLEGLRARGMALLLLFAPDAPVSPVLGRSRVKVEEVRKDFYRVSGLTGEGPPALFFGLVEGVFVVASDERRAREIAGADAERPNGLRGASVMSSDAGPQLGLVADFIELDDGVLDRVSGSFEASRERLRGRLRIELP